MTKNKGGESSQPLFSKLFYVGVDVTIYTFDDGSAMQECVFFRAQRASLMHTAAGIPQGGGGVCGTQTGVVICMCSNVHTWYLHQRHG